jgi:hemolysin III
MYYGERLNSISHLVGAVFALVGLGALLTVGVQSGDLWVLGSFTVFGVTMVLLYTMSTLYHSFHPPGLKKLFQLFDHVAIYLLIAGTYTPFMLVSLRDGPGVTVMLVVWGLALLGIISELLLSGRAVKVGQLVIYLAMGWAIAYDIDGLRAAIPEAAYYWLLAGGLAYTGGVVFYVLDKLGRLRHAHGIWHMFVLLGSLCHFVSIIGYIR